MIAPIDQNTTQTAAADVLERMVRGQLLPLGDKGEKQFMADAKVSFQQGWASKMGPDAQARDTLVVVIDSPHIAAIANKEPFNTAIEQSVINAIPALKKEIVEDKPKNRAREAKDGTAYLLEMAKKDGIADATGLSEWIGFSEKLASMPWKLDKHAVRYTDNEMGFTANVELFKADGVALTTAPEVANNLQGRLDSIKKTVANRISKYLGITDDAKKAEIEKEVAGYEFSVSFSEGQEGGRVSINVRSPEQIKARQELVNGHAPKDPVAVSETNLLFKVKQLDEKNGTQNLGKLMGRAILMDGTEEAKLLFPKIAGREDMKRTLGKIFAKLGEQHKDDPQVQELIKSTLEDDIFKDKRQHNKSEEKREYQKFEAYGFVDPEHPTQFKVRINLPSGKAQDVLKEIAALAPAAIAQPQPEAPAVPIPPAVVAAQTQTPATAAADPSVQQVASEVIDSMVAAATDAAKAAQASATTEVQPAGTNWAEKALAEKQAKAGANFALGA